MQRSSRALSRLTAVITAVGLTFAGLTVGVVMAPAASAEPGPVAQRTADTVTSDSLPTAQIDGVVWSQVIIGNTVYAGGDFATARPPGSAPGQNTTPRNNLVAYDITTGQLTSFAPNLNGQVLGVAASPDGSRLYAVGDFTTVDGVTRNRVAVFNTATGALTGVNINIATRVKAVTATNSTIYVGGQFTAANGQPRARLAAFNAANGGLLSWNPGADATVNALVLTPDGSKLIAGGAFQNAGGGAAYGLAAIEPTDGGLLPWATNQKVRNAGANSAILSLSTDGTSIFGTGYVFGSGGNLEGAFRAEQDGTLDWVEDCHGDSYGVYSNGSTVYVASHAHYCGNIGGFPQTDPWSTFQRRATAFTINATGTANADPLGYPKWTGTPSPSMINWFPNVVLGTYTGQGQAAWTVTGNSQYVVMGGEFPTVNGTGQQGLARFAVKSISGAKVGPTFVTGAKFVPTIVSPAVGEARISFQANADQDDTSLTYKIVRNSVTASPILTTTVTSTFWNRPMIGFTDKGLTPGVTYRYRLYVTDPDGNQTAGDTVNYTVPAAGAPSNAYTQAVISQGASTYWRLGESSGTAAIDAVGYNDGLFTGTVTRGAAGAIAGDNDTATTFNGSNAMVATRTPITAPNTFTTEAWVKTTSTTGGRIMGFSNLNAGNSSFSDRHAYMDNSGKIYFAVKNDLLRTINSSASYNDGQWHQVVTSLGPDGMNLYVDGVRVAKRADTVSGIAQPGYWRVGGDQLTGAVAKPSSTYLNGAIDEVSIYPTVLTVSQIAAQYAASGRTSPLPAAPSDTYGAAVFADQPDLYYRLGEASGTVAADSGPAANPGNYVGTSTKGAAGAISGTTNSAVTFNGSTGYVASATSFNNPTTYSEEAWFKTNTTRGGKIIGFGSSATALSSSYDRHVYLQNDGKVVFGTNGTGGQATIISPTAYNNDQWHQVVATQGADGMKLYLDGQLVGSNPATTAQNYVGYWRVGGDRTWNSTSSYLAGTIDEAAVYSTVLSPQRVLQHYQASGRSTGNIAPIAGFTSSTSALSVSVNGSGSTDPDGTIASYAWDFGDTGTGTGATASHTYTAAGTYTVGLTVTDDAGATNTKTAQVTVAAANVAPVAAFTSSAQNLELSVDGSTSADSDGSVNSYAWTFGDNGTATGATATHTYAAAGTYTVGLTVTDNGGLTNTVSKSVTVSAANVPPTAAFTSTVSGSTASFNGTGSADPDGTIASYAWEYGDQTTGTGSSSSHSYAAPGTYSVKLTVTDNSGATASVTNPVTIAAPGTTASDLFGRTIAAGWGSAESGGSWTSTAASSTFSANGSVGQMRMATAGSGPVALLNGVSTADLNGTVDVAIDKAPTGSAYFQGNAVVRRVVGTPATTVSDYRVKLKVLAGSTSIQITKVVNGAETSLVTQTVTGVTYAVGDVVRLSFQVKGASPTTLSAKAWKVGSTEPAAWRATTTDSAAELQGPGVVGLQGYLSSSITNAPVVASFDNFAITPAP